MSELAVFKSAGLPAVSSLSSALRAAAKVVAPAGGVVLLKMDRTGHWVYGADQEEVEAGSKWAVNPFSFIHGFIAWGDRANLLGEKMAPMTEPLPDVGAPPAGSEAGWQIQIGFSLKCISGQDAGMEARFATTTHGGKRAVQELALAVAEQVDKDQSKPVAIVTLSKDFYQHGSYGRIYTPVFDVQEWVSMDGPEAKEEAAAEEPAAPARRRRVAV